MKPYNYHIRLSGKDRQILRALKHAGKTERRVADRARMILWQPWSGGGRDRPQT